MNDYGPLYIYRGAIGFYIESAPTLGFFIITTPSSTEDFIGWLITADELGSYPYLEKYIGMRTWHLAFSDLKPVGINLGEIYE